MLFDLTQPNINIKYSHCTAYGIMYNVSPINSMNGLANISQYTVNRNKCFVYPSNYIMYYTFIIIECLNQN